jgi:hypothetical protein
MSYIPTTFTGFVEDRLHIWKMYSRIGKDIPKEKGFLWTPLEFELDENRDPVLVLETLDKMWEDATNNEETAKIMESWEYNVSHLIPFLEVHANKYWSKSYPEFAFVFLPRFIKGTYILPRDKD